MDLFYLVLAVFAYLSLQSEAKPFLLDADYMDDDLVAEETRAFAHASANGGAFASAGSFSFGGFGGPLAFVHPFFHHHQRRRFGSFFPQPYYEQPPFPAHQMPMRPQPFPDTQPPFPAHQMPMRPQQFPAQPQQPMRKQNERGYHNNPYQQMQLNRPFGNNNTRPKQPPQDNTQIETLAPVPNVSPISKPEVIATATPSSLPASSVVPVKTESTSTTTEGPFYDIDIRIAD